MDALRLPDISPRTLFTKREKEVLELVTSGLSTKEIASRLSVDVQTINTHRKRMMKKLHVKNIHGVICFGFVNGILDINVIKELMTHQTYGFSPKSIDRSIN